MLRFVMVVVMAGVLAGSLPAGEVGQVTNDMQAVAGTVNVFAADLYAKLKGDPGNLFFSPYSLSTALAMTSAGARDNTAAQMSAVLRLKELPAASVHPACGALTQYLNRPGKQYQLAVANRLWGMQGYEFIPAFLDTTRTHYGAELQRLDFAQSEAARATINGWAEQQTQQRIKDLIPSGALDALTRLVLTNAIYFKGNWQTQFKKEATKDEPFVVSADERPNVPMMNHMGSFGYFAGEGFQALEMPYAGDELSMVVFLPKEADGLKDFEAKLTAANVKQWIGSLRKQDVRVAFPRFTITWGTKKLNDTLIALGMSDVFNMDKSDLSGIGGKPHDLYITHVFHKAFVEVNEEGTEAAAATAVVVGLRGVARPQPIPVFRADHPFVFLIREKKTGAVLFMARVANPKA
jgi:serpin B